MRQIVLDTETTGLDPRQGHKIIEIGALELVDRQLSGRQFHVYINPERDIEAGALEVHGITDEFLRDKPVFADVVEDLLGEERYAQMYPAKSVFDSGARVTFSSDEWWGGDMLATYISPYLGMQVGHTRQYPKDWWETEDEGIKAPVDERLSLEQLLTGYTKNGAYQLRQEDRLGSIEAGKLADFVILDENLFEVGPYEISKIKPSAVVMEGKVIQGAFPE